MSFKLLEKAGNVSKELEVLNTNMSYDTVSAICTTLGSVGCGSFGCGTMGGCC